MRILVLLLLSLFAGSCSRERALRVCADPNNLPFSNRAGEGFENKLAELIAREQHARLDYVWWAQRRGYVRNTLNAGSCDLWPGVASSLEMLATSRPYYRSTYVFVTRTGDRLSGLTLDDARLRRLRLGVQLVGDDGSNTPPAEALARRSRMARLTSAWPGDRSPAISPRARPCASGWNRSRHGWTMRGCRWSTTFPSGSGAAIWSCSGRWIASCRRIVPRSRHCSAATTFPSCPAEGRT